MNRITIRYKKATKNIGSQLIIYNDIKGLDFRQIGCPFYGTEADIMLDYFQKAIIPENDTIMNYGIEIIEEGDE